MNLKNLKNFKQGVEALTPLQLSVGRLAGYAGLVAGALIGIIYMIILKLAWYWWISLIFVLWLQVLAFIAELKTYYNLFNMQQEMSKIKNTGDIDGGLE